MRATLSRAGAKSGASPAGYVEISLLIDRVVADEKVFEGKSMSDLNLAAMLCSRLCHDLVGPIGAIGNGIELLSGEDDPEMRVQALGLLEMSAKQATARLRFYRLAFGAAGSDEVPISVHDAREAALAMFEGAKVAADWPAADGGDVNIRKIAVRLALNLVAIAGAALLRGGTLSIRLVPVSSGWRIQIDAKGPTVRLDENTRSILSGGCELDEIDARDIQIYYASALARAIDSRIEIARPEADRIVLSAQLA